MPTPDRDPTEALTAVVVPRARYSDVEKADGLLVASLCAPDYDRASDVLYETKGTQVPAETLRNWHSKARGVSPAVVQLAAEGADVVAVAYDEIAARCAGIQTRLLDHVEAALDKADEVGMQIPVDQVLPLLRQITGTGAIATEKRELLNGRATSRSNGERMNLHAFLPAPSLHEVLTESARGGEGGV